MRHQASGTGSQRSSKVKVTEAGRWVTMSSWATFACEDRLNQTSDFSKNRPERAVGESTVATCTRRRWLSCTLFTDQSATNHWPWLTSPWLPLLLLLLLYISRPASPQALLAFRRLSSPVKSGAELLCHQRRPTDVSCTELPQRSLSLHHR